MQATLRDILAVKGESVQSTTSETKVLDAVNQMRRQKIGALLVVEDGDLKGIFTERDVLFRVVNEDLDPAAVPVSQVMTATPSAASATAASCSRVSLSPRMTAPRKTENSGLT